jgi:hypothetical protein
MIAKGGRTVQGGEEKFGMKKVKFAGFWYVIMTFFDKKASFLPKMSPKQNSF